MKRINVFIKPIFLLSIAILPAYLINNYYSKAKTIENKVLCPGCNVIIVSLDTLGSGHMPCYGYDRDTTPNLCKYAEKNILFENAYSNSFWTLPATPSMMTGLVPQVHKITRYSSVLPSTVPLLPEVLDKSGYETIFASPADDLAIPLNNVYNRGIDKYMDDRDWEKLFNEFRSNNSKGIKTFMYIHNYSVHAPYMTEDEPLLYTTDKVDAIPITFDEIYNTFSPELFDYIYTQAKKDIAEGTQISEPFEGFFTFYEENRQNYPAVKAYYQELLKSNLGPTWVYMYWYNWYRKIDKQDPRHIEFIKALYDQKVRELDEKAISGLIEFIQEPEISRNTVLIITSEHGEEFAEHGEINHITIYNSNIRIPLIIHIPGISASKVEDPVQLADLMPTILDIVGVKNEFKYQGISLVSSLKNQLLPARLIMVKGEIGKKDAIMYKDHKLIYSYRENKFTPLELYDLKQDKDEKNNILMNNFKTAKDIEEMFLNYVINWNKVYFEEFLQQT